MTFIRHLRSRYRHERPDDPPAQSRIWTSAAGVRYRVWLAETPRHLAMHGRTDMVLTFVPLNVPLAETRDIVRSVPAGTVLEQMTDEELEARLATNGDMR